MDQIVGPTSEVTISSWTMVLGTIVVIAIVVPLALIVAFMLATAYYFVQAYYRKSSRELQRLDSLTR